MIRRRPRGLVARFLAALGRLAHGLVVVALLPLALPVAVPFFALATPEARARVLREHLP